MAQESNYLPIVLQYAHVLNVPGVKGLARQTVNPPRPRAQHLWPFCQTRLAPWERRVNRTHSHRRTNRTLTPCGMQVAPHMLICPVLSFKPACPGLAGALQRSHAAVDLQRGRSCKVPVALACRTGQQHLPTTRMIETTRGAMDNTAWPQQRS